MCLFSAPEQPQVPVNTPDYTPDQSERGVRFEQTPDTPKPNSAMKAAPAAAPRAKYGTVGSGIKM